MFHRLRARTSAGRGGSVADVAWGPCTASGPFPLVVADGWANASALAKTATRQTPIAAKKTFFIQQLLPRLLTELRANAPFAASGGGTAACGPRAGGRGRRPGARSRRSGPRP